MEKSIFVALLLGSAVAMASASGPVPKYGEALCHYEDKTANVEFEFYIARYQNSYDFKEMNGATYYVTVTPDQEILLVGVLPMTKDGQVDSTKSAVGRGFNTITRAPIFDSRGAQTLACDPI